MFEGGATVHAIMHVSQFGTLGCLRSNSVGKRTAIEKLSLWLPSSRCEEISSLYGANSTSGPETNPLGQAPWCEI